MWTHLYILGMLLWGGRGAPGTLSACPEGCECFPLEARKLDVYCPSQEFLDTLGQKQISQVVSLNLRAQYIKHVSHKLKKLYNLKKLDLSHNLIEGLRNFPHLPKLKDLSLRGNNIQHLTASELPKSMEYLDVSSNNISHITDLSNLLPHLKELDLNNNFVSCECDTLKERDFLLQNGVHIVRPVSCSSPASVKGKSMLLVYCSEGNLMYDEFMAGDEPDVGSGDVDAQPAFDDETGGSSNSNIEDEYFIPGSGEIPLLQPRILTEGSGEDSSGVNEYEDYGSGEGVTSGVSEADVLQVTESNVRACYFHCSTPRPFKIDDSSEPSAEFGQELTQIFNELTGQTEAATVEPTTLPQEIVTELIVPVIATHSDKAKSIKSQSDEKTDRGRGAIQLSKDEGSPKELEKQSQEPKRSNTTFIIVGVLLVLMAGLIVYAVIKRRAKRQNNRRPAISNEEEKNPGVEMKSLIPPKPTTNDAITLPEKTPLMNGQNGTHSNKEAEEPEVVPQRSEPVESKIDLQIPDNEELPEENVDDVPEVVEHSPAVPGLELEDHPPDVGELDDVDVHPKRIDENLLTPETKRVTIQAKELSSPKTPVFVHRHLSDDGRIITTPSLDQRK